MPAGPMGLVDKRRWPKTKGDRVWLLAPPDQPPEHRTCREQGPPEAEEEPRERQEP